MRVTQYANSLGFFLFQIQLFNLCKAAFAFSVLFMTHHQVSGLRDDLLQSAAVFYRFWVALLMLHRQNFC